MKPADHLEAAALFALTETARLLGAAVASGRHIRVTISLGTKPGTPEGRWVAHKYDGSAEITITIGPSQS